MSIPLVSQVPEPWLCSSGSSVVKSDVPDLEIASDTLMTGWVIPFVKGENAGPLVHDVQIENCPHAR